MIWIVMAGIILALAITALGLRHRKSQAVPAIRRNQAKKTLLDSAGLFSLAKISFKLVTLLLFIFILQEGFLAQLDTLSRSENPTRNISVFLLIWCLTIASSILISLIHITLIRVFWGVFFAISILGYLTFLQIMGYPPTLGDAKILWIETGQAKAAFMFYWSELILPLILSLLFFVAFVLPVQPMKPLKKYWALLPVTTLPLLPLMMISGMLAIKGGGAGVGIPGGMFALSSYAASITYEVSKQSNIKREAVPYPPPQASVIKNIILVVDESISSDFISLNPDTTITPILANNRDIIANFGQASSGHNCSSFSNAILRWGINPTSLLSAEKLPTIWQYAKAAGFTTTYIDAQKHPGTYGNLMNLRETEAIDNIIQFNSPQIERDINYISNDFEAAKTVIKLTSETTPNFIYINKLGAHFPYEGKYPENFSKHKPHMSLFKPLGNSTRKQLINSYKNAISWNIDRFFKPLTTSEQLQNTVVIYTSDHGQNLLDQGTATHCNRNNSSPYQALVPLLIMTRDKTLLDTLKKAAITNKNAASHFNIFPTALALMGYPAGSVEQDYTKTLFSPIQRLGKFSTGNLLLPDINKRSFGWQDIPAELKSRM